MSVLRSDYLWKAVVYKALRSVVALLWTLIKYKRYNGTDFCTHLRRRVLPFPTQNFMAHILNRKYGTPNESSKWNVKFLVHTIKHIFIKRMVLYYLIVYKLVEIYKYTCEYIEYKTSLNV
jgi:hypothetical protein